MARVIRKKKTEKPSAKKEAKKVLDKLGKAESPVPRHAMKQETKTRKASTKKVKPEAPVAGALSKREAERSLWAPRVEPKAKRAKKK
jgi:hypothetical protein